MTHVPVELAQEMLERGQVKPLPISPSRRNRQARVPTQRKMLPLHCVRFIQGSSSRYYYTVIDNFPHPPQDKVKWDIIPRFSPAYHAQELLLDQAEPSIGWASFFDTQSVIRVEASAALRRFPDHTSFVGRPVLTKVVNARRLKVPAAMLSLFAKVPERTLPEGLRRASTVEHLKAWFVSWTEEHALADRDVEGVRAGEMELMLREQEGLWETEEAAEEVEEEVE